MEAPIYRSFFVMLGLGAVTMFLATYAMIASLVFNLNTFYMTGLMIAPMATIMLLSMLHMCKDKRMNATIIASSALDFLLRFFGIRKQTPIGDSELLRAVISHHFRADAAVTGRSDSARQPRLGRLVWSSAGSLCCSTSQL